MAKVIRSIGPGRARLEALLAQKDVQMRVGFLDPDAAYKAVIHENGVEENNLPPRPFMQPAVDRNREKWKEMARGAAPALLDGTMTLRTLFGVLAQNAAEAIQQSIDELQSPALAEITIAAKEAKQARREPVHYPSKPLIETGHMRDSVLFDVEDN